MLLCSALGIGNALARALSYSLHRLGYGFNSLLDHTSGLPACP